MTEDERQEWHLDRKVSIAMIIGLLGNMAAGVWFASKMDSRVERNEAAILTLVEERSRMWDRMDSQNTAVSALRADIAGISARLDYMTRALDRLTLLREQDRRIDPPK